MIYYYIDNDKKKKKQKTTILQSKLKNRRVQIIALQTKT
jgi:amino acid permease